MSDLPTGTVTFLFTDIEGSAMLAQQFPAELPTLLARHHAIMHHAIQAHNGHVFQIIGDAFCAAFYTSSDALKAALDAQRALQHETWNPAPVRVRMGIHTGAAQAGASQDRAGGYVGYLTLTRVQRVMSIAHGGQVLLSNAAAELVRGELPTVVTLCDMGEHRLKGLVNPEHLWQLTVPDLRQNFPPLQSLTAIPNNLPVQLTSFIGRENELARISEKLAKSRLVTLTGSGGVGKTRLAIQTAHECLSDYRHGAWLIELAPLADPALVPLAIITTFGLQEDAARSPLIVLTDYLREKTLLLVLDNCEHVIDACAELAEQLLLHCHNVRILASSREALGIDGEVAVRVPSLSLPSADKITRDAITHSEAALLFVERAATALPDFALTDANCPAVAQVCRRLDGIALAIELAASRVKVLRVEQIADRLDDAFRLLTGGRRTALPRQQTLRATIDWSYNLLNDTERIVLRRLSVFAGGAILEAAEAVCADDVGADPGVGSEVDTWISRYDVLDIITQLVNKSLVFAEREQGRETRYYLLETICQYAREKLNDNGEGEAVRERHTRWCVDLAERAEPRLVGHGQLEWLDRMEQEHDNIRAALEWSFNNNVEPGMRIASALRHYWSLRGHAIEGFQHLESLIAARPLGTSLLSARALSCAGWVAMFTNQEAKATALATASENMSRELGYREGWAISLLILAYFLSYHGDDDRALPLDEEGLALFVESDNKWGIRLALGAVGSIQQAKGNYEQAQSIYQESLALSREIGDVEGIGYSLFLLGDLASEQSQYEQALAFYEESLVIVREVEARYTSAWIMQGIGYITTVFGQYDRAKSLFQDCVVLCQENGEYRRIPGILFGLGRVTRLQSDYEQAAKFYADSLQLARKYEQLRVMAWNLAGLAELAALRHQSRKAARLLGAANAIPELYLGLWPSERLELEQMTITIRNVVDEATFNMEQEAGRQMPLDEAVAYALKED